MAKETEKHSEAEQMTAQAPAEVKAPEKGFLGKVVDGIRKFSGSGFFKGVLIAGAIVMGVMAIVAGAMGAGAISGLAVGGIPVVTFEGGIAAGLSKGLEFLTSSTLGYATLAAGGLAGGVIGGALKDSKEQAAKTPDEHAKLLEHTKGLEKQKNKEVDSTEVDATRLAGATPVNKRETEKTHSERKHTSEHTHTHESEHRHVAMGQDASDSIYLANSTVTGKGFRASELKRRVERETVTDYKTI